MDQILHGARAVLLRVHDHARVTGWRRFLVMMVVGMLGGIVVGVVMGQVGLIRGLVMLHVVRVARGARRGVVRLVVEAAIGVHDHAADLVQVRRGRVGHVVVVVRVVAVRQGIYAQRARQMIIHGICAATGARRGRVWSVLLAALRAVLLLLRRWLLLLRLRLRLRLSLRQACWRRWMIQ